MTKSNPFRPGAGKLPPYLAGRERETAVLTEVLQQLQEGPDGTEIVLSGPRGMGKTVLLMWLQAQCQAQGILAVRTTPPELGSIEGLSSLLPVSWLPRQVTAKFGRFVTSVWDWSETERMKVFSQRLSAACKKAAAHLAAG